MIGGYWLLVTGCWLLVTVDGWPDRHSIHKYKVCIYPFDISQPLLIFFRIIIHDVPINQRLTKLSGVCLLPVAYLSAEALASACAKALRRRRKAD